MKQKKSKLLAALAFVFLLAGVLCTPGALAASDEGITVLGTEYAGADFVQFKVESTLTEQLYFDLFYTGADGIKTALAQKVACDTGEIGFDALQQGAYELAVYSIESGEPAHVANGRSVSVFYQLDSGKTTFVAYRTVGEHETAQQYTASSAYYDADAQLDYDLKLQPDASATVTLAYSTPTLLFSYASHEQAALEGMVTFVDTKGNILQRNTFPVLPENTAENPAVYPVEGKLPDVLETEDGSFVKASDVQRIATSYTGKLDYTVLYKPKAENGAYTAVIRYVDENNVLLLTDRVAVKDKIITYFAPTTFSRYDSATNASLYYSTTADKAKIVLQPGSASTTYEVQYTVFDGRSGYDWSIRLVDGGTGALLGTQTLAVPANGSATYTPEAALTVNGAPYTLDAAMQSSYTHTYGDVSRVQYVYYNPEGYTPASSYNVTVQYKNIADGSVLYSEALAVYTNQDTVFACPENYAFGGVDYVRLNGQTDTLSHSFYSPKRTYTVYYRDVNDTQYKDTVVTVTEVITSENIQETIIYRAGAATAGAGVPPAAGQTLTTVDNQTTGDNTLLTDNGTTAEAAREEIADNGAPLAANSGEKKSGNSAPWMIGAGVLVAVVLLLAVAIFVQRKKKKRPQ